MSLLKKLVSLLAPPAAANVNVLTFHVRCDRCGEILPCRINLANDLSIQYGKSETDVTYVCRKVVIGDQHCFQKIEIELTFDSRRKVIEQKVIGGKSIDI